MIAKIISGTSFRACAQYLLRNETAELLGGSGVRLNSTEELIVDFQSMLLLIENQPAKPVGHTVLSFSHDDRKLSNREMCQIAVEYLNHMKITDTPYILVRHSDKTHQHIHLMYSAVNYDGRMINQRHNFARSKQACRQIEKQLSLTSTLDKRLDRTNISALRGADLCKYQIYISAKRAISEARSWNDFVVQMNRDGVGVELSGSDKSRGVRFSKGDYHFAGSKVDRSLSYRNIIRGIVFANAKRNNISPMLQIARYTRQQTDRHTSFIQDIRRMFHTSEAPTQSQDYHRNDELTEEEQEAQLRKEQRFSF